jgi:sulfur carrier protein
MADTSPSMNILLNGQIYPIASGSSVADLLVLLEVKGKRIAVELNGDIVTRGQFVDTTLSPMDRIEIVHAIGGG